jgi:hypothetical protein
VDHRPDSPYSEQASCSDSFEFVKKQLPPLPRNCNKGNKEQNTGILRCAQNDKAKVAQNDKAKDRSRFPSGMTSKKDNYGDSELRSE